MKWYPPRNIASVSAFAETAPLRNIEVNVVNMSKGFNVMIKVVFPLFPRFIKDRFRFHSNDHESLARQLGKDILPPHLNGTGPPLDFDKMIDNLYKRLEELEIEKEQKVFEK